MKSSIKTIGSYEAKTHLPALLKEVAAKREIIITLGVLLRDEHSAATNDLEHTSRSRWIGLETANGLLMAERRRRVAPEDVTGALRFLQGLTVTTDEQ